MQHFKYQAEGGQKFPPWGRCCKTPLVYTAVYIAASFSKEGILVQGYLNRNV